MTGKKKIILPESVIMNKQTYISILFLIFCSRMFTNRLLLQVSRKISSLIDELSAVKIQRYYRGYFCRKTLKAERSLQDIQEQIRYYY